MAQMSSLSVTDNLLGKIYEIPISQNAIQAAHFKQRMAPDPDAGLLVFDPGFEIPPLPSRKWCPCANSLTNASTPGTPLAYLG